MGIIISRCKDPYETSSIMESSSVFFSRFSPLSIDHFSTVSWCGMLGATVYSASSQWQGDGLEGIRVVPDHPLKTFVYLISDLFTGSTINSKPPFFTTICGICSFFPPPNKANLGEVGVCFFLNLWGHQVTLLLSDNSMFGNSSSWGRTPWKIWVPVVRGKQNPSWSS